jgi:hypothetical protein
MAGTDTRLSTPVHLDDTQLARVKLAADNDLAAIAHAMQRYAAVYLAHRQGEMADQPDPSVVGCDEHNAAVARAVVEQALNAEVLHGGAGVPAGEGGPAPAA